MRTRLDNIRKATGYVIPTVCIAISVLPLVRLIKPLTLPQYFSLLIALVSVTFLYAVARLEKAADDSASMKAAMGLGTPPIKVFHSIRDWASNLLEESRVSVAVCTEMFSDGPSALDEHMTAYFRDIHREIRQRRIVFKRLATTGSKDRSEGKEKVRWLLSSLVEMADVATFSLAIIDIDHKQYPLNAFQVCRRANGEYAVFVFSSNVIDPGEHTCMIRDMRFGEVTQKTFDQFWMNSTILKLGNSFNFENINALATKFNLLDSPEYRDLLSKRNPNLKRG